jgi:hypothetical protein
VAAFACVKALNNTYIRTSVSCLLDIYVLRGHLTAHYQLWSTQHVVACGLCAFVKGVIYINLRCQVFL